MIEGLFQSPVQRVGVFVEWRGRGVRVDAGTSFAIRQKEEGAASLVVGRRFAKNGLRYKNTGRRVLLYKVENLIAKKK